MTPDHPELVQPAGAPDQKTRVLEWLREHPEGLTQLDALQHLAVMRLAAVVLRLREDGHAITTELVEMPTRYGPATAARYHLAHPKGCTPGYDHATTLTLGQLAELYQGARYADGGPVTGGMLRAGEVAAVLSTGQALPADDPRRVSRASLVPVAVPADQAPSYPAPDPADDPWAEERRRRAEAIRREAFGE